MRFTNSNLIRILFKLRRIASRDVNGIANLYKMGFLLLEVIPDREVILGLVGQFWKPDGNIQIMEDAGKFLSFSENGFVKATWNFTIVPSTSGCCELRTETRIQCIGTKAKRRFRWYWFIIKPFSGWIRMEMLKAIRRDAEKTPR